MTRLSVNLNKIALLRNSRTLGIPSVARAATIALDAGARGITVHPRPDGRHIRIDDVRELAALLKGRPDAEFNIEGNPFEGLIAIAREVLPQQCTLVPDDPGALTSDHGWDISARRRAAQAADRRIEVTGHTREPLHGSAARERCTAARELGADRVELYTEPYARAFGHAEEQTVLTTYAGAADAARSAGLGVNAGHDLNQQNLTRFLSAVPQVLEVSIGHALVADAMEAGLAATVRGYLAAIAAARA